jgi:adenine-specific DNA-methyltransferase
LFKRADTLRRTGQDSSREKRSNGWFPVFIDANESIYTTQDDKPRCAADYTLFPIDADGAESSWSWSKLKINSEPHNLVVVKGRKGPNIYKKQRAGITDIPSSKPKSLFYKPEYSTSTATSQLKVLLEGKFFEGPKPVPLLKDLVFLATQQDSIILDFFSGSATTAHAVMQLNAEDGGKRRHIMVQLPEPCDEKSEAYKAGYQTIAEIGKERIRRAGQKVMTEWHAKQALAASKEPDLLSPNHSNLLTDNSGASAPDIGFRVLKIDSSNFRDVTRTPDELDQAELSLHTEHIKPDRTPQDLLFQVLVDWGVDLALPIREEKITAESATAKGKIESKEYTVYWVDDRALAACFDAAVPESLIHAIATRKPLRAVFRDECYDDDSTRINVEQIFKLLSPATEVKSL